MIFRCIIYYLSYKTIFLIFEVFDILYVFKVKRIKFVIDGILNIFYLIKKNLCNYVDFFFILDFVGRWIIIIFFIVRKLGVYVMVILLCIVIFIVVLLNIFWKL